MTNAPKLLERFFFNEVGFFSIRRNIQSNVPRIKFDEKEEMCVRHIYWFFDSTKQKGKEKSSQTVQLSLKSDKNLLKWSKIKGVR